jgi:hypothetical protein
MKSCVDLDLQKVPKENMVGHHETCCLLFANYGFWFAFFIVWMMFGVDQLVLCATYGCNNFGECGCAI